MLEDHALQMTDRLLVFAARHLELREPHERIVALGRERIVDDDSSQVALGVGRRLREHRAPVQRLDVAHGARVGGIELALDEITSGISLSGRDEPAGPLEHIVACRRGCRGVGVRGRLDLGRRLRGSPFLQFLLCGQRCGEQRAAGEE